MGNVVATCSGQRYQADTHFSEGGISDGIGEQSDNSLKVWSMPFLNSPMEADADGPRNEP